jgi:hypothetical protein
MAINRPVTCRAANPGWPAGPPGPLAWRLCTTPTHFPLNLHGI